MATRAVKRYGRGLNSFTYRPGYGIPKLVIKPKPPETSPSLFYVRPMGTGEFQVFDQNSGKLAAGQFDTRAEAEAWIDAKVKG